MSCTGCTGGSPKAIIRKAVNIVQGNFNRLVKDPDIELMALSRLQECNTCEFRKLILTLGTKEVYACGKCGDYLKCPVESKTRAPKESCPINKW